MTANKNLIADYYKCIYEWYSTIGKQILEAQLAEMIVVENKDVDTRALKGVWFNHEFIKHLPEPNNVTPELIDYIVTQVIYGKLEWAFHNEDKFINKMSWYAKQIADMRYPGTPGNGWSSINEGHYSGTELYKVFGKHHEKIDEYANALIAGAKNI